MVRSALLFSPGSRGPIFARISVARVPRAIDSRDELPDADAPERRRLHLQILEQAGHLRRVGQGGEGRAAQRREDQEVKAHADGELEAAHEVQDLARRVAAPQDLGALRVLHVSDDGVAVLNVGLLHRHEHDVGVVAFDDEVRGVREQRVVLVGIDVRRRRARLSDREADEMSVELDALGLQRVDGQLLRLEQERGVGGEVDLAA